MFARRLESAWAAAAVAGAHARLIFPCDIVRSPRVQTSSITYLYSLPGMKLFPHQAEALLVSYIASKRVLPLFCRICAQAGPFAPFHA